MRGSPPTPSSAGGTPGTGDRRFSTRVVRAAYDMVATDYTVAFGDDLAGLPVDRAMLDAAADRVADGGLVLDLGCGPAPVSGYLTARGARAIGADVSGGMLSAARSRNPGLAIVQADMRCLSFRTGSLGLVVAYYSIQHLPRGQLAAALDEIGRVVGSDGALLLATHLGDGDVYIDEFLGHRIEPLGGALYQRDELLAHLDAAGFVIDAEEHREPLSHEAETHRIYILARRPAQP